MSDVEAELAEARRQVEMLTLERDRLREATTNLMSRLGAHFDSEFVLDGDIAAYETARAALAGSGK